MSALKELTASSDRQKEGRASQLRSLWGGAAGLGPDKWKTDEWGDERVCVPADRWRAGWLGTAGTGGKCMKKKGWMTVEVDGWMSVCEDAERCKRMED